MRVWTCRGNSRTGPYGDECNEETEAMNSRAHKIFVAAMLLVDLIAVDLSVWLAYQIRFASGWMPYQVFHPWAIYPPVVVVETLLFPITFVAQRLYRLKRGASRIDELYRIFTAVSIGTVVTMAITSFAFKDLDYSRAMLSIAWLLCIFMVWIARLAQYWLHGFLRSRGIAEEKVLLVGSSTMSKLIANKIRHAPRLGYQLVGYVHGDLTGNGNEGGAEQALADLPVLGSVDQIGAIVHKCGINEVIVADPSFSHQDILDIVAKCEKEQVNIKVFPDVFQIMASEVAIGDLDGLPMVSIRDIALRGWNLTIKRALDLLVSVVALVLLSPLLLFISFLIKLTSPGAPVLYVQERVGLDGKPFPMIKFRSMRPDAEAATGPVWAKDKDPRRTRLGAFLRRFSIDELLQFVNVLLGEMSVVGPRPERPHFVEQFSLKVPRYLERHKEKAGITGWAQVNGLRGNTSIEERTAYDLWYVEHWTIWLDIKIMLRTLISVLRDKNAY